MKKLRSIRVALAATFLVISSFNAHAAVPAGNAAPKAAPPAQVHRVGDQSRGFLVKFKPGLSEEQMAGHLAARGLGKAKRFHAPKKAPEAAIGRWWHVSLADPKDAQALRRLKREGLIERIEANLAVRASGVPDDPQFAAQWGVQNIGQAGGVPGADIRAPQAWDRARPNGSALALCAGQGWAGGRLRVAPGVRAGSAARQRDLAAAQLHRSEELQGGRPCVRGDGDRQPRR
jgi:hypothetical protein